MYGLNKMTESQVYKSKVLQVLVRGSDIEGQGLFATRPISSGQRIEYFDGYEIDHPTRHSLTFNGTRIEPTGSLRFLNHSCSPNAFFVGRWLVALCDITAGVEVTIDYLATESGISNGFMCKCGSENCRGSIGRRQE
jgi:SET domain-containing protein